VTWLPWTRLVSSNSRCRVEEADLGAKRHAHCSAHSAIRVSSHVSSQQSGPSRRNRLAFRSCKTARYKSTSSPSCGQRIAPHATSVRVPAQCLDPARQRSDSGTGRRGASEQRKPVSDGHKPDALKLAATSLLIAFWRQPRQVQLIVELNHRLTGPMLTNTTAARWTTILAFCLLLAFAANFPLVAVDHIWLSVDLTTHFRWLTQFSSALLGDGWLYPRWMPLANLGLGEPAFVYYAPLYYFATTFLIAISGDAWLAIKMAAIASTLASAILTYVFCTKWAGTGAGIISATLVALGPFYYFVLHLGSALPWHFSLPFVLATVFFSIDRRGWFSIPLSLSIALLASTHILSAFMTLICLPAIFLLGFFTHPRRTISALFGWVASVVAGLSLAAAYLLPALTTWDLISPEAWFTPAVDWRNSFAFPIVSAASHGVRWFSVQWLTAGVILLAVIAATLCAFNTNRACEKVPPTAAALLSIAWCALFFASELSYPLWANIGFLRKVQLPYRFLFIAGATGAIALSISIVQSRRHFAGELLSVGLVGGALIQLLVTAFYQWQVLEDGQSPEFGPHTLDGNFGSAEYATFTRGRQWRDYVQAGGLTEFCERQGALCQPVSARAQYREWEITTSHSIVPIALPIFSFPAWSVQIDGTPVDFTTDFLTGLILVELSDGPNRVVATWQGLPQERWGARLSVLTATFLVVLAVLAPRRTLIAHEQNKV
jgi:hypothetical protein